MQMIPQSPKRQRATVIVERDDALVLVQTRQGLWLLPGGGVTRGELPIAAAARELHEETETNVHHVFHAVAAGDPQASDDAADLVLLREQSHLPALAMSLATRNIIDRFRKTWHAGPA
jgi:ADP-ribose pyrophosphatase YjhB (NUDIX family)